LRAEIVRKKQMGIFGIIWMIIVGFIVGALARWLYPGAVAMSWAWTVVLGVIGSLIGGVISMVLFRRGDRFHPAGFILSVIGALIALWVYLNYFAK
jgi:uncharacterized membrane protein YeaQ/YmgE (transglycosylase-associated protein family)